MDMKTARLTRITAALVSALLALSLSACAPGGEPPKNIDLIDAAADGSILTFDDLTTFLESGSTDTATLLSNIDCDGDMLRVTKERGHVTINGGGFSITSNQFCVIRLDEGCSVTLNDVTVVGGAAGIGCLGAATVGGTGLMIESVTEGIDCPDILSIADGAEMVISSGMGSAVDCKGLVLGEGAAVDAVGAVSAVKSGGDGIAMNGGSALSCRTKDDYNAMKCAGELSMKEGASLTVINEGDYHGAEIESITIDGTVSISAAGGGMGVGMFIFNMPDSYHVLGSSAPMPRYENGKGSLVFHETREELDGALAAAPETEG